MEFRIESETFELPRSTKICVIYFKTDGQKQPATGVLQKSCSENLSKFHTETHDMGFVLAKLQGSL